MILFFCLSAGNKQTETQNLSISCFTRFFPSRVAEGLPTFAVDKVFQGVTQGLLECFLRMQLIRIGKSAEETPYL